MYLDPDNRERSEAFFRALIETGIDFKLHAPAIGKRIDSADLERFLSPLPDGGQSLEDLIREFELEVLPSCTNFASPNFMGFPDAGNSVAAIGGSILSGFLQQNLINQSFCGPSATFVEIAVIRWLRAAVGFVNNEIADIWDVGGITTVGGTSSNSIGILLAREHKFPGAMQSGDFESDRAWLVVPKGIGHYSVKSAQMWLGMGSRLLEVETDGFRYDLHALQRTIEQHADRIMAVVAYAGDSRTMTVDNMSEVANVVRKVDDSIWLHADACHGFALGFSEKLRHKIAGIEEFDSITTDPHKVLATPYVLSALLVREPSKLKTVTSQSDLIMQEEFAFGQVTPFFGTRAWDSLKLWFALKQLGSSGVERLIEERHELACYLSDLLDEAGDFLLVNRVDINSVAFLFVGEAQRDFNEDEIAGVNELNSGIHQALLDEGQFHLHQFTIPDDGALKRGVMLRPLRFMSGNPSLEKSHIQAMVQRVREIGATLL